MLCVAVAHITELRKARCCSVSGPSCVRGLQVLEHEHIYLDALPSAQMYERSYMHRDVVTHVLTAQEQDFIITGSADGHLKFWKKKGEGIEFAKHFRAHMEAVAGLFCHVAQLLGSWLHH